MQDPARAAPVTGIDRLPVRLFAVPDKDGAHDQPTRMGFDAAAGPGWS